MKSILNFKRCEWEKFIKEIDFTDVELELIKYIRRGWYDEDIAAELHCCRSTISRMKKSIYSKIKENSISEIPNN